MTNEQLNKKIEALKAELDQLRGSVVREPVDAAAMGRWQDEMRQGAERRALRQYAWSAQELAAMNAACPNAQDIVHDNRAPQGPGDGTGWAREIPIGNPPGTRWVDAQLDAQDAKDRRELIEQKAKEQALLKAAEPK